MRRNNPIGFILDLLFPSSCVGCGSEGTFLCEHCRAAIVIKRLPALLKGKTTILVYAAADYDQSLVKRLIHALKYEGLTDIAEKCAALIHAHLSLVGFVPDANALVTAVPLSRARLKERGFNQAELIARNLAKTLSLNFRGDFLARARHTTPQTETVSRSERIENVKDAFACYNGEVVRGKEVILVDDVMTTGATLSECARALKKAGAKKVITLVVAA